MEEPVAEPFQSDIITRDSDSVPDDAMYQVLKYYNMIPSIVRKHFESDGWTVVVSNNVPGWYNSYDPPSPAPDQLAGFATTKGKKVYITNHKNAYKCVIHELGHYIDYRIWIAGGYNYRVTEDADWLRIYNLEVGNFKAYFDSQAHNIGNAKEYWAEAFSNFVFDADGLSANCPNTYNWIVAYYEQ